jgi:thioredoxin-like negative regulator of GroEL
VAQFAGRVNLTTLVDRENDLARVFGYRAIPNGFAFGPDGALLGSKIPGFDIRDTASRALLDRWLATSGGRAQDPEQLPAPEPATEALDLFAEGSRLMRNGDRTAALQAWAKAFEKDPKDFVIRKQIWRALYPDRFGEPIDLGWQREQMAREEAVGFLAANPGISPATGS